MQNDSPPPLSPRLTGVLVALLRNGIMSQGEGMGRKHGSLRRLNEKEVMGNGSSVRKGRSWEYRRDGEGS